MAHLLENLKVLWNIIDYPLYVIVVLGFIVMLYLNHRNKKVEEPDEIPDDPTGNSNIKKKFYDYS